MKRESVSKSRRFAIFARDGFACQYCGRKPPDVILEVDHIVAVVNGGSSEDLNLITACFDCNHSKGKKDLGSFAPRPDADLEFLKIAQERLEIEQYLKEKKKRDKAHKKTVAYLTATWQEYLTSQAPPTSQFNQWLTFFSPNEIEFAIKKATGKFHKTWWSNPAHAEDACRQLIRYTSGIMCSIRSEKTEPYNA